MLMASTLMTSLHDISIEVAFHPGQNPDIARRFSQMLQQITLSILLHSAIAINNPKTPKHQPNAMPSLGRRPCKPDTLLYDTNCSAFIVPTSNA